MKKHLILILLIVVSFYSEAQNTITETMLWDPILIDSSSVIIFPVNYNIAESTSSGKTHMKRSYLANYFFYDLNDNSRKYLFETNTFINRLNKEEGYYYSKIGYSRKEQSNFSENNIFYLVINEDYNSNNKINNDDPSILYASDLKGNNLKKLTESNENVVKFTIDDSKNLLLVRIQNDKNGDKKFTHVDKSYYYKRFDLSNLKLIEIIN